LELSSWQKYPGAVLYCYTLQLIIPLIGHILHGSRLWQIERDLIECIKPSLGPKYQGLRSRAHGLVTLHQALKIMRVWTNPDKSGLYLHDIQVGYTAAFSSLDMSWSIHEPLNSPKTVRNLATGLISAIRSLLSCLIPRAVQRSRHASHRGISIVSGRSRKNLSIANTNSSLDI
jgi:hypothetical protein